MSKHVIHVDLSNMTEAGDRFLEAWRVAEEGAEQTPYQGLSFTTLDRLLSSLTLRRWELLAYLRRQGAMSIYALAKGLKRDYKNVHTDVRSLEELGLIQEQTDGKVLVPWDEIEAHIKLAA